MYMHDKSSMAEDSKRTPHFDFEMRYTADPWSTNMVKHLFSRWFPTCQPAWKNHDEYLKLTVQIQVFRLGITQIQKLMAQKRPGSPHEMAATLAKPHPQMPTSVPWKNAFPCQIYHLPTTKKRNNEPTSKNSGRKKKQENKCCGWVLWLCARISQELRKHALACTRQAGMGH